MGRGLRILGCACLAAGLAAAGPGLAAAQTQHQPGRGPQAAREPTADKLEATRRRSKELQGDLNKIQAERERINALLLETAKLIQQSEGRLTLIESRLGDLEAQAEDRAPNAARASRHDLRLARRHAAHGPEPAAGDDHATRGRPRHGAQRNAAGLGISRAARASRGAGRAAEQADHRHDADPHGGRPAAGGDGPPQRRPHAPGGPAGVQAPVADRTSDRAGAGARGGSRDLEERVRPERPDRQARQGGRRAHRPWQLRAGDRRKAAHGGEPALRAPSKRPPSSWHPRAIGWPC